MDSRISLAPPPSLQRHQTHHHQQQLPPGMMMMPPNLYTIHHHVPNNSTTTPANNNSIVTHESMQRRFALDGSDQYGDGSSPTEGLSVVGFDIEQKRKKRGRPRKYSPSSDGDIALGLTPAPVTIGSSAGGGGHLESLNSGGGTPNADSSATKRRGRRPGLGKKQLDALGEPGVGFTPYVMTVKVGEDVASKMTAFSQQGPHTVCILSANGAISNVTLRQPATWGGTVTYEGLFEIISLSGSFKLTDSDGNHSSRSSELSVSLAGSDGRVLGGRVVGALVAATPIQVVVASFISDAKKAKSLCRPAAATPGNMLTFGGGGSVPGASQPSDGASNESSEDSASNPPHRHPSPYGNASQQAPSPPPQSQMHMYSNMGWPNSTMHMFRN